MKVLIFKYIIYRLLSLAVILLFLGYKHYMIKNSYYVIINRGKIDLKNLFDSGCDIKRLYLELKRRRVDDISYVDYGLIDRKGRIELFIGNSYYPLPIIVDGIIDMDSLFQINKDKSWLLDVIDDKGIDLKSIVYCFYKKDQIYFIER